jgi:hypothetical protein
MSASTCWFVVGHVAQRSVRRLVVGHIVPVLFRDVISERGRIETEYPQVYQFVIRSVVQRSVPSFQKGGQ